MIGKRLKGARLGSGLSLRALSDAIGNKVTAQAIGKYERNEDMPRSDVLIALANVLGVSVDFLLSDDVMELENVEFRKTSSLSAKERATIEAKALSNVEKYLAIECVLNMSSQEWDKPKGVPYKVNDPRDAEDAARNLREAWLLGKDPIPKFSELLEERGIKVFSIGIDGVDGLAAHVSREGRSSCPIIMIKEDTWAERIRFTLAHELGHLVLSVSPNCDVERMANRFAGAFLIPADTLRQEIGSKRADISIIELLALKDRFGVSIQALTYRCKDLEIISQTLFSRLFDFYKEQGWRDDPYEEPHSLDSKIEKSNRFDRLCFRGLSEGLISLSRASELLDVPIHKLERYLDDLKK